LQINPSNAFVPLSCICLSRPKKIANKSHFKDEAYIILINFQHIFTVKRLFSHFLICHHIIGNNKIKTLI
jgi:hypothetical protein